MKHEIVRGADTAAKIADALVRLSVWFEVTPEPNDFYRLTVKDEERERLIAASDSVSGVTRIRLGEPRT